MNKNIFRKKKHYAPKNLTDIFHTKLLENSGLRECVHCGKRFCYYGTDNHQAKYCPDCRENHRGKEIIEEEE